MNRKLQLPVLLLTTLLLSSCAGESPAHPAPGSAPQFAGPYADELTAAWQESDSTFVRTVIEDEVISDAEWSELAVRMQECVSARGLIFESFTNEGGYSIGPSDLTMAQQEDILDDCDESTGTYWLIGLRQSMITNPENTPVEEWMTECLIRNEAVGADYTKEDFLRDNPELSFPFMGTEQESIFWSCTDDPSFDVSGK